MRQRLSNKHKVKESEQKRNESSDCGYYWVVKMMSLIIPDLTILPLYTQKGHFSFYDAFIGMVLFILVLAFCKR